MKDRQGLAPWRSTTSNREHSMFVHPHWGCALLLLALAMAGNVSAQVTPSATRLVLSDGAREATLRIKNTGQRPSLVQAWTDDGDLAVSPEKSKAPFLLRPPLFRLDEGKSQVIRLLYTGEPLPHDHESLFWLNLKDIPPVPSAENASGGILQMSQRTRIKVFYRPKGLNAQGAASAAHELQWQVVPQGQQWVLQVSNPTPYHVSLSTLELRAEGTIYPHSNTGTVAPKTSQSFALQGLDRPLTQGNVHFSFVNDQGGNIPQSAPLTP